MAFLVETSAVYRDFLKRAGFMPLVQGGTLETRCWIRHTADGGIFYVLSNGEAFGKPVELRLPTTAGEFKLSVPQARPSMVWVDGQKRVRAVMAEGKVTLDGKPLFSTERMTILAALTPGDIRSARSLFVSSLWPGEVGLPKGAGRSAVMGEIRDGKWRTLEKRVIEQGRVSFDALQAREFTVISDETGIDQATAQVEVWVMRPWDAGSRN